MNEKIYDALNLVVIVLLLVVVVWTLTITNEQCSKCQTCENIETFGDRFEMYSPRIKTQIAKGVANISKSLKITNGVYFPTDRYYCVWTEGREPFDVNQTDRHEACHDFINKEPQHFCEGKKW